MEKLKSIIIGALFTIIIILLLLRGCNTEIKPIDDESVVTHDTIVKYIPAPYKVVEFKPIYYPKWDTIKQIDSSKWSTDLCKFERIYNDSTSDSNVTIFSNIKTIGILKSSQLSYRLKVPIRIETTIRTDSTYIKVKQPTNTFTIIGGIGGNQNQFNATIGLAITNKNAYYGYSYDISNKTHNAHIGLILFKSKK